ncbi:hypothetical protein GF412_03400 [Candidatus Micrarchaeota archaeon]|nr:hypothetical protein [Candidatus Micrarchaeota archaeon]MBD3417998.1 hypothetical protein [Candidatus Micrarchaeota archaeon]
MFKRKVLRDKRDDGKGSGGKPTKPKFSNRELLEPPIDPRVKRILSFMRGEPVDFGEPKDTRDVLFSPPPDKDPEME